MVTNADKHKRRIAHPPTEPSSLEGDCVKEQMTRLDKVEPVMPRFQEDMYRCNMSRPIHLLSKKWSASEKRKLYRVEPTSQNLQQGWGTPGELEDELLSQDEMARTEETTNLNDLAPCDVLANHEGMDWTKSEEVGAQRGVAKIIAFVPQR